VPILKFSFFLLVITIVLALVIPQFPEETITMAPTKNPSELRSQNDQAAFQKAQLIESGNVILQEQSH
jgi:hypothetical protein